jgi:hypothetical protein
MASHAGRRLAEIRAASLMQIIYQLQVVIPAFIIPGR